jgi:hypothetical protein
MRYLITLLFLGLMLSSAAGPSRADNGPAKTLQALYDREDASAAKKDLNGTLAYVSPDFKGVTEKGETITYDETRQQMTQLFGMAKTVRGTTKVTACKVSGSKATAAVNSSITIVVSQGQDMTLVDTSTSSDTWTKTKAGWRLTFSRVLKHTTTVNGQPAPQVP